MREAADRNGKKETPHPNTSKLVETDVSFTLTAANYPPKCPSTLSFYARLRLCDHNLEIRLAIVYVRSYIYLRGSGEDILDPKARHEI